MQTNRTPIIVVLLAMLTASLACGSGSTTGADATVQALNTQILETATAAALANVNANAAVETARAQAISQSKPAELTATAEAFAPRLAELSKYGVDPAEGRLG